MTLPVGGVLGVEKPVPLFEAYSSVPAGLVEAERSAPIGDSFASKVESFGPLPGFAASDATGLIGSAAANKTVDGTVPFAALFNQTGLRYNIAPTLLAAVAKVESNFNTAAVSKDGAQGLMQFMPGTSASRHVNPWDPASAIDGAAQMLTGLYQQFGTVEKALAAYNGGPGWLASVGGVATGGPASYAKKVISWAQ